MFLSRRDADGQTFAWELRLKLTHTVSLFEILAALFIADPSSSELILLTRERFSFYAPHARIVLPRKQTICLRGKAEHVSSRGCINK